MFHNFWDYDFLHNKSQKSFEGTTYGTVLPSTKNETCYHLALVNMKTGDVLQSGLYDRPNPSIWDEQDRKNGKWIVLGQSAAKTFLKAKDQLEKETREKIDTLFHENDVPQPKDETPRKKTLPPLLKKNKASEA